MLAVTESGCGQIGTRTQTDTRQRRPCRITQFRLAASIAPEVK